MTWVSNALLQEGPAQYGSPAYRATWSLVDIDQNKPGFDQSCPAEAVALQSVAQFPLTYIYLKPV